MPGDLAVVGISISSGTPFTFVFKRSANKASSLFRRFGFPYLRTGVCLGENDLVEPPVLSLWWHRRDDDWDRSLPLSVHEDDVAGQAEDEHGEDEKAADN